MSRSASARSRLQIGVLTVPAGLRLAQQETDKKQSKHAGLDGRSDGLLAVRDQLNSRRDLITEVGRPLLRANELREGLFRPGMAVPGVAMVQRSPRARVGQSPPRLRPRLPASHASPARSRPADGKADRRHRHLLSDKPIAGPYCIRAGPAQRPNVKTALKPETVRRLHRQSCEAQRFDKNTPRNAL